MSALGQKQTFGSRERNVLVLTRTPLTSRPPQALHSNVYRSRAALSAFIPNKHISTLQFGQRSSALTGSSEGASVFGNGRTLASNIGSMKLRDRLTQELKPLADKIGLLDRDAGNIAGRVH